MASTEPQQQRIFYFKSDGLVFDRVVDGTLSVSNVPLYGGERKMFEVPIEDTSFLTKKDFTFDREPLATFCERVPWYTPPTSGDYLAIFIPYFNHFREYLFKPFDKEAKQDDGPIETELIRTNSIMVDVVPSKASYSHVVRDAETGELTTMAVTMEDNPGIMYMVPIVSEDEQQQKVVTGINAQAHCSNALVERPLALSESRFFYDSSDGVASMTVSQDEGGSIMIKAELDNGRQLSSTFIAMNRPSSSDDGMFQESVGEFNDFDYSNQSVEVEGREDWIYVTNIVSGTVYVIFLSRNSEGESLVHRHYVIQKDNLYRVYINDMNRLCYVYGKNGHPELDSVSQRMVGPDQLFVVDFRSKVEQELTQLSFDVVNKDHMAYKVVKRSSPSEMFPPLEEPVKKLQDGPVSLTDMLPPAPGTAPAPLPIDVLRVIVSSDSDESDSDDEEQSTAASSKLARLEKLFLDFVEQARIELSKPE
jgi:hypothetical protein